MPKFEGYLVPDLIYIFIYLFGVGGVGVGIFLTNSFSQGSNISVPLHHLPGFYEVEEATPVLLFFGNADIFMSFQIANHCVF